MKTYNYIAIIIIFLLYSCKSKDSNNPLPSVANNLSYTTTLVMLGHNQNNNISVVVVNLSTSFSNSIKKVSLTGRVIKFNHSNKFLINTKIETLFKIFDKQEKNNFGVFFEDELKLLNGYQKSTQLDETKIIEFLKFGKANIKFASAKKFDLMYFLASIFSTPAYAQANISELDEILIDLIRGAGGVIGDCSDKSGSFGNLKCYNSIIDFSNNINALLQYVVKEFENAINPNSTATAETVFNNLKKFENQQTGNSSTESSNAGSWGDPHFTTLDDEYYDFQGVGEFLALKSTTDKLELQVRQQPYGNSNMVSVNTAIAFNTGSDIISFNLNPKKIFINKKEISLSSPEINLNNGGKLTKIGEDYKIKNSNNDVLSVLFNSDYLNYIISLNNNRKGKTLGLLGNFDGDKLNDITIRNGTKVDVNDFKKLYSDFADSWRITQTESLFEYESGKNTISYTDKNFPSKNYSISQSSYQNAVKVCTDAGVFREPALSSCVYDVALSGNTEWAKNYLPIQKEFTVLGPIAYYPFNNNVNDESGNNNNGKIFGNVSFVENRKGKAKSAIDLNGIDQFIRVDNSFMLHNMGQEITISAWVLWKDAGSAEVVCKASQSEQQIQFQFFRYSGTETYFHTNGGNVSESKFSLELNKWYQVVLLIDGTTRRFYVNGEFVGTKINFPTIKPNYSPLEIGRDFFGLTELHKGSLDDIRIYNRVLSNKEIKDIFMAEN
ncbi:MAG TPA: LamG-like jellyroll fold domain-containing protein [Leadbetterella sp.]|nr:LamG-like jellyroll fold domain-containing protein [Leadbetterella sp.]